MKKKNSNKQQGFGIIGALIVLVMLAALAAAIASLTNTQNQTAVQNARATQAWQAARAGNEWGFHQATHGALCVGAPQTSTLNLGTGFNVTVTCTPYNYNEGQIGPAPYTDKTVRVFRIMSVACPSTSAACPDNVAAVTSGYVERTRVIIVTE